MLNIIVTDAVSVSAISTVDKFYLSVSVSDLADATDVTWLGFGTVVAYDSVSVLESTTLSVIGHFKQLDILNIPVRRVYGEFLRVFSKRHLGVSVPLRIPVRTGLGYFGARLSEERIPTRSASATVADPSIGLVGGVNTLPVWSGTGRFGSRLEGKIPVRILSASFDLAGIFSLDSVIPVRSLTANFGYPSSFTLSRQIPVWMGQGSMELLELTASLAASIPGAFIFTGKMYEVGDFRLAGNIPVRRLESSIYASSFSGDMEIPVPVPDVLIISQHTRFSDYVLRYTRP